MFVILWYINNKYEGDGSWVNILNKFLYIFFIEIGEVIFIFSLVICGEVGK